MLQLPAVPCSSPPPGLADWCSVVPLQGFMAAKPLLLGDGQGPGQWWCDRAQPPRSGRPGPCQKFAHDIGGETQSSSPLASLRFSTSCFKVLNVVPEVCFRHPNPLWSAQIPFRREEFCKFGSNQRALHYFSLHFSWSQYISPLCLHTREIA